MNNSNKIIEQPLGEWYKDTGSKIKDCLKLKFILNNEKINKDNIKLLSGKEEFELCKNQKL